MEEIQRTIITRAQLADRGYKDAYTMSDKRLGEIADELFECLGINDHLTEALNCVMQNENNTEPFTAYYIRTTRQLLVYAGTHVILMVTIDEDCQEDCWHEFQFNDLHFDANLSWCYEEVKFDFSIYPVEDHRTITGRSIPVNFHDCIPRFQIGDKVRFTEKAIRYTAEKFGLDELWAQTHREKEYEILALTASPEYDHIVVSVRHTAEDDTQQIAEYNLTNE